MANDKICDSCKKIIEKRITYLELLQEKDHDLEREHLITQFRYFLKDIHSDGRWRPKREEEKL